MGGRVRDHHTW